MVMQGLLFTNDIPFHTVYLHGLVRDEHGRKMSKTTGNVEDPIKIMDEYGTDALRFTLLTGSTPGNDMNLAISRVAANRNFANKIWNATRFVTRSLEKATKADATDEMDYTTADQWILSLLSQSISAANRLMDNYQFGEAGRQVYDFLWGDFADWYVELAKVQLNEEGTRAWTTLAVLGRVLDDCLRLLHPYIPFVTEETWQQLKSAFEAADIGLAPDEGWPEALIIADWPQAGAQRPQAVADFERLRELVRQIRAVRAEYNVEPGRWITAVIAAGDKADWLNAQRPILAFLARLDEEKLVIAEDVAAPETAVTLALGDIACYLPLAGMIDLDKEKERLGNELADVDEQIGRVTKLLDSPFAEKAPAAVVEKEREKLARLQSGRLELAERLAALGSHSE
jgi:valyl-tRNA synthetase